VPARLGGNIVKLGVTAVDRALECIDGRGPVCAAGAPVVVVLLADRGLDPSSRVRIAHSGQRLYRQGGPLAPRVTQMCSGPRSYVGPHRELGHLGTLGTVPQRGRGDLALRLRWLFLPWRDHFA
jgi:hypothetical protein